MATATNTEPTPLDEDNLADLAEVSPSGYGTHDGTSAPDSGRAAGL